MISVIIKFIFQILATVGVFLLSYFEPIKGPVLIFFVFFVLDFITGILASFNVGERFKSSKARWSFVKLLTYTGSFAMLIFISKELNTIGIGNHNETFKYILKMVVYAGIWFEAKSIIENLCVINPHNKYLKFLDYLLGVEFLKKIPSLSNFLKQDKDKNTNNKNEEDDTTTDNN